MLLVHEFRQAFPFPYKMPWTAVNRTPWTVITLHHRSFSGSSQATRPIFLSRSTASHFNNAFFTPPRRDPRGDEEPSSFGTQNFTISAQDASENIYLIGSTAAAASDACLDPLPPEPGHHHNNDLLLSSSV
jgi:hypothetical protein